MNKTNRAIVAIRNIDEEKINFIRKICSEHNVELNFLPSIESFKNDLGKLNEHSGVPLISKQCFNKNISFFYRISKKNFRHSNCYDYFFCFIALLDFNTHINQI